jgi:hypothetical protein
MRARSNEWYEIEMIGITTSVRRERERQGRTTVGVTENWTKKKTRRKREEKGSQRVLMVELGGREDLVDDVSWWSRWGGAVKAGRREEFIEVLDIWKEEDDAKKAYLACIGKHDKVCRMGIRERENM